MRLLLLVPLAWCCAGQLAPLEDEDDAAPEDTRWTPAELSAGGEVAQGITKCATASVLDFGSPAALDPAPAEEAPAPAPAANGTGGVESCAPLPPSEHLVDQRRDLLLAIALAACASVLWCAGWVAAGRYTVDDGYVDIPRCVDAEEHPPPPESAESKEEPEAVHCTAPRQRVVSTVSVLCIEGPQLCAVAFSSYMAPKVYSPAMQGTRVLLNVWLFRFDIAGVYGGMLGLVIVLVWLTTIIVYGPVALALLAARHQVDEEGEDDAEDVDEADGEKRNCAAFLLSRIRKLPRDAFAVIEWVRDCYLFYMPLPCFMVLLGVFRCTYYQGEPYGMGEKPRLSWDESQTCWAGGHAVAVLASAVTLIVYYAGTVAAGMLPFLVEKTTDLSINGRYTAIAVQLRFFLAVSAVCFDTRHVPLHLSLVCCGTGALTYFTVQMRPSPVERVNFLRFAVMPFAVWSGVCNVLAAAMDDRTALTPHNVLVTGWVVFLLVLCVRYFAVPHTAILPPRKEEGGMYEGDVSLGLLLRHGVGTQSWADGAEYVGEWWFGKINGQGVFRLANGMYYEGGWKSGTRSGFGRTTIMPTEDAISAHNQVQPEYEGGFANDMFEGFGIKTFADGEVYEGEWREGTEHGAGKWVFRVGGEIEAEWENGKVILPDNRHIVNPETYQGDWRYGVPHGHGRRLYGPAVYSGQFCAGQRHGPQGNMQYSDGSHYVGDWVDDCRQGHGIILGNGIFITFEEVLRGQCVRLPADYGGEAFLAVVQAVDTEKDEAVVNWNQYEEGGPPDWLQDITDKDLADNMDEAEQAKLRGDERLRTVDRGFWEANECMVMESYCGEWMGDKRDGFGTQRLVCGEAYAGHWERDYRRGYGQCDWPDGRQYLGSWENGELSGIGQLQWPSGDKYSGPWREGLRHGRGNYNSANGDVYDGEFQRDKPHGSGEWLIKDVGCYDGDFMRGVREGRARFEWTEGSVYDGQWGDNQMEGRGALTFRSDLTVADLRAACAALVCEPAPRRYSEDLGAALIIAVTAAVTDVVAEEDEDLGFQAQADNELTEPAPGAGEAAAEDEWGEFGEYGADDPPKQRRGGPGDDQMSFINQVLKSAAPLPPQQGDEGRNAAEELGGQYEVIAGDIGEGFGQAGAGDGESSASEAAGRNAADELGGQYVTIAADEGEGFGRGQGAPRTSVMTTSTFGEPGEASDLIGDYGEHRAAAGMLDEATPADSALGAAAATVSAPSTAPRTHSVAPSGVPRLRLDRVQPSVTAMPSPGAGPADAPVLLGVAGGRYDGEWHLGQMEGEGLMVFGNGSEYFGQWVANRPHGKGRWHYASEAASYEGCFEQGRRHGIGMMKYADGRQFLGHWERDQRHGKGHLSHPKGLRGEDGRFGPAEWRGYWCRDRYVGEDEFAFLQALTARAATPGRPVAVATSARSRGTRSQPASARSAALRTDADGFPAAGVCEPAPLPPQRQGSALSSQLGGPGGGWDSSAWLPVKGSPQGSALSGEGAAEAAPPPPFRQGSALSSALSAGPVQPPLLKRQPSELESPRGGGGMMWGAAPHDRGDAGSALSQEEPHAPPLLPPSGSPTDAPVCAAAAATPPLPPQLEGSMLAPSAPPLPPDEAPGQPAALPAGAEAPGQPAVALPAPEVPHPLESPAAGVPGGGADAEGPAAEAALAGRLSRQSGASDQDTATAGSPSAGAAGDARGAKQRRKELGALLNEWKARFKEEHGKDPTKKDIRKSDIAALFEEYNALKAAKTGKRKAKLRSRSQSSAAGSLKQGDDEEEGDGAD